jgi:hypothetical protein
MQIFQSHLQIAKRIIMNLSQAKKCQYAKAGLEQGKKPRELPGALS